MSWPRQRNFAKGTPRTPARERDRARAASSANRTDCDRARILRKGRIPTVSPSRMTLRFHQQHRCSPSGAAVPGQDDLRIRDQP